MKPTVIEKGKKKETITMSVQETYGALLLKTSEMIDTINKNQNLWYEIKNSVLRGMIYIVISQVFIIGLLLFK